MFLGKKTSKKKINNNTVTLIPPRIETPANGIFHKIYVLSEPKPEPLHLICKNKFKYTLAVENNKLVKKVCGHKLTGVGNGNEDGNNHIFLGRCFRND